MKRAARGYTLVAGLAQALMLGSLLGSVEAAMPLAACATYGGLHLWLSRAN